MSTKTGCKKKKKNSQSAYSHSSLPFKSQKYVKKKRKKTFVTLDKCWRLNVKVLVSDKKKCDTLLYIHTYIQGFSLAVSLIKWSDSPANYTRSTGDEHAVFLSCCCRRFRPSKLRTDNFSVFFCNAPT